MMFRENSRECAERKKNLTHGKINLALMELTNLGKAVGSQVFSDGDIL